MFRKIIIAIVIVILLAFIFAGCTKISRRLRLKDGTSVKLIKGAEYKATARLLYTFEPFDDANHIVQGAYFDGKFAYVAMIAGDDPENRVRIVKINNGKAVQASEPLDLDHANNIAYNSKLGLLVVSHCQSNVDNRYAWYSFVDPVSLKVVSSGELSNPFFAMGYCASLDQYGSGEWGGQTVDVWDGEMRLKNSFSVETPPTLSQGCFCNEDYIWFVRSSQNGYPCELRLYDWNDGTLCYQIPIEGMTVEPENINIVNGKIYIICNNSTWTGGELYVLELSEVK